MVEAEETVGAWEDEEARRTLPSDHSCWNSPSNGFHSAGAFLDIATVAAGPSSDYGEVGECLGRWRYCSPLS